MKKCLKPVKAKLKIKRIYGFDIETTGQKNNFYCATIYQDKNNHWQFDNKKELIAFLKTKRFQDSYIAATNLMFDFFGLFKNELEKSAFKFINRGSELISAVTYIRHGKFSVASKEETGNHHNTKLTFIDTNNYGMLSVKKMGKILNLPKLKKPKCLGKIPKNEEEKKELLIYNMRDAEISQKFTQFLHQTFINLGAEPKATIASTAMNLFKSQFLTEKYWVHEEEILDDIFESYYGGRVEVFKRGYTLKKARPLYYGDFNSLYPSVMLNDYPDPNTLRTTYQDTTDYIMKYEGVSQVEVHCPEMKIPLLPARHDKKLYFPTGDFQGWYTHVELRKAISIGYKILKVHKTHYYKGTCSPFKPYVLALYSMRQKFKAEKNPMEYVIKILLNSLYGKFGQKYKERIEVQSIDVMADKLNELITFDRIGDYIIYKKKGKPSCFCFPIWATYTTAYARIKLWDKLIDCDPYYCDTDSIISEKQFNYSNELGELKLEYTLRKFEALRPKMYAGEYVEDDEIKTIIKLKGGRLGYFDDEKDKYVLSWDDWEKFKAIPKVQKNKFIRFRESLRQHLDVNEILQVTKDFSLEDCKRDWPGKYYGELQNSTSVLFKDSIPLKEFNELKRKVMENFKENIRQDMREFIKSDKFDIEMVGNDITPEEFIEDEKWGALHD